MPNSHNLAGTFLHQTIPRKIPRRRGTVRPPRTRGRGRSCVTCPPWRRSRRRGTPPSPRPRLVWRTWCSGSWRDWRENWVIELDLNAFHIWWAYCLFWLICCLKNHGSKLIGFLLEYRFPSAEAEQSLGLQKWESQQQRNKNRKLQSLLEDFEVASLVARC